MTKAKKVTVTAIVDFDLDKDQSGVIRLWGVDFIAKDGKLTASMSAAEAKAMKVAGRVV